MSVWLSRGRGSGLTPVCISPRSQRCWVGSKSTSFMKFWKPGGCGTGVPWIWVRRTGLSRPPWPQSLLTCEMQMMKTPALGMVVGESLETSTRHQRQDRAPADPGNFRESDFLLLFSPGWALRAIARLLSFPGDLSRGGSWPF